MNALPIIIGSLCVIAIAYRYYSAFIAAKVLALDDSHPVPSQTMYDGHNYYPTNKWVLFGHHFAAISGAGPLIGPVLAAQFGFLPGLLWLVIGVCLGGAVHDFMILAGSVRRKGKSLAEMARTEISPLSGIVAGIAILFIVVIALAGLGLVVVKALGEIGADGHAPARRSARGHAVTTRRTQSASSPMKCHVPAMSGADSRVAQRVGIAMRQIADAVENLREVGTFPEDGESGGTRTGSS